MRHTYLGMLVFAKVAALLGACMFIFFWKFENVGFEKRSRIAPCVHASLQVFWKKLRIEIISHGSRYYCMGREVD